MTAMGLLVFGLIDSSATSNADSRAAGIAATVATAYRSAGREASLDAGTVARDLARPPRTLRDLAGAYEIAERARSAIEGMAVPRLDDRGWLKVTASVGVAASPDGEPGALVVAADNAMYAAKRSGRNRTERADAVAASHDGARELARSPGARDDE